MTIKKLRIQAIVIGDSANILAEEQKKDGESQSVTLRRIIKSYKKMKDNGCKCE